MHSFTTHQLYAVLQLSQKLSYSLITESQCREADLSKDVSCFEKHFGLGAGVGCKKYFEIIQHQNGKLVTACNPPNSKDLKIVTLVKLHSEQYALKLQNSSPKIKNRMFAFVACKATFEQLLVIVKFCKYIKKQLISFMTVILSSLALLLFQQK